MEKPLCRFCGARHYSHEPHAGLAAADEPQAPSPKVTSRRPPDVQAADGKPSFDRTAYQRTYMKAWRRKQAEKRRSDAVELKRLRAKMDDANK